MAAILEAFFSLNKALQEFSLGLCMKRTHAVRRVRTDLLSFEYVDEFELFLEAVHQLGLLFLKSLVGRRQLLRSLLLVIHAVLLTTTQNVSLSLSLFFLDLRHT